MNIVCFPHHLISVFPSSNPVDVVHLTAEGEGNDWVVVNEETRRSRRSGMQKGIRRPINPRDDRGARSDIHFYHSFYSCLSFTHFFAVTLTVVYCPLAVRNLQPCCQPPAIHWLASERKGEILFQSTDWWINWFKVSNELTGGCGGLEWHDNKWNTKIIKPNRRYKMLLVILD